MSNSEKTVNLQPQSENTITYNKPESKTLSIIVGVIIVIVLVLIGLTIWNIITIRDIQKNIKEDVTKKLSSIITNKESTDNRIDEIAKLVLSYDGIFNLIKGTYKTKIIQSMFEEEGNEELTFTVDIYPFFEYFNTTNSYEVLPIGDDKTITFDKLKQKLGIENRNYSVSPLLIHFSVKGIKNKFNRSNLNFHGYLLLEKDKTQNTYNNL